MSDAIPTPADIAPDAAVEPAQADTVEVDDTDWKAEARKWEQRAKENKGAADELAHIKDSQKSEAEKAADALSQARADAEAARSELLRYRTAAEHGITNAEDIELFLTGTDEGTLQRQAKALAARSVAASSPRTPRPDPNQGRPGDPNASTADQFAGVVGGLLN